MGEDGKRTVVTDEMLDAAMKQLWTYDDASDYIDRDMMREILEAAFSGVERTTKSV